MRNFLKATGLASVLLLTACGNNATQNQYTTSGQVKTVQLGPVNVSGPLGQEPTVTVTTSMEPIGNLMVADSAVGSGPAVTSASTVTAHYVGYGVQSGAMFDGSWSRGEPATFPLNGVIQGWQVGLVGMQAGGRRVLVIPGDMAYGDAPPGGSGIAPNEPLIFVVDLVSIQ